MKRLIASTILTVVVNVNIAWGGDDSSKTSAPPPTPQPQVILSGKSNYEVDREDKRSLLQQADSQCTNQLNDVTSALKNLSTACNGRASCISTANACAGAEMTDTLSDEFVNAALQGTFNNPQANMGTYATKCMTRSQANSRKSTLESQIDRINSDLQRMEDDMNNKAKSFAETKAQRTDEMSKLQEDLQKMQEDKDNKSKAATDDVQKSLMDLDRARSQNQAKINEANRTLALTIKMRAEALGVVGNDLLGSANSAQCISKVKADLDKIYGGSSIRTSSGFNSGAAASNLKGEALRAMYQECLQEIKSKQNEILDKYNIQISQTQDQIQQGNEEAQRIQQQAAQLQLKMQDTASKFAQGGQQDYQNTMMNGQKLMAKFQQEQQNAAIEQQTAQMQLTKKRMELQSKSMELNAIVTTPYSDKTPEDTFAAADYARTLAATNVDPSLLSNNNPNCQKLKEMLKQLKQRVGGDDATTSSGGTR